jgi:hypothetical protein
MSGGAGRIHSAARSCHKGESDHAPTAHSDRTLQAIATLHGGAQVARPGTLMPNPREPGREASVDPTTFHSHFIRRPRRHPPEALDADIALVPGVWGEVMAWMFRAEIVRRARR